MPHPLGVLLPGPSEAEFTSQVLQLARLRGWRTLHLRPARTAHGWRTAVQGDGAGWPDLVLVRGGRLVVAELKVGRGRLSPSQTDWLDAFRLVPGVEVHVWYPRDFPEIERVLL